MGRSPPNGRTRACTCVQWLCPTGPLDIVRQAQPPHLEGWRDWPLEAPATTEDPWVRDRCQLQQAQHEGLEDVGETSDRTSAPQEGGGFFRWRYRNEGRSDVTPELEMQGMRRELPARGPLRM